MGPPGLADRQAYARSIQQVTVIGYDIGRSMSQIIRRIVLLFESCMTFKLVDLITVETSLRYLMPFAYYLTTVVGYLHYA